MRLHGPSGPVGRALAVLCALSLEACTRQGFLEAPKADTGVTDKIGSFGAETHFLLEPTADAEDLLGRAVHVTSAGGWTIADERAPGCQVRVKRSAVDYEKSYRIGLGDMTALSGGYGELLKLEARYGRSVEAAMKIHNLETLTADTEGPCGEVIVNSVRVGTGERRLQRKAEGAATGKLGKGPIAVGAGREALTDAADEMRWSSPQAYAFTYKQAAAREVFELHVEVPRQVDDGDRIELRLTATAEAFLVIYYVQEDGKGVVLYPNPKVPVPTIAAGQTLVLPGGDGPELAAQLLDPKVGTRDTLVLYAFAARGDFDHFKPMSFADGDDVVTYAARLTQALSAIPISRWDRHTTTIEIQPRSP